MKTTIKSFFAVTLAVLLSIPGYSQNYGAPLPIVSGNDNGSNENRSPEQVPFRAYVLDSYVVLSCASSIGNAVVTLTSTAGDDYETVFNTAYGTIIIPISGNSGSYRLDIVLPSGAAYYGEFVL